MDSQRQDSQTPAAPWWRHGHVWLLLAGPAAVVVAGVATAVIAFSSADTLVTDRNMTPALQSRNHAATGGVRPR